MTQRDSDTAHLTGQIGGGPALLRRYDQHGEVTLERALLIEILTELKAIHATMKEQKQ